MAHLHACFFGQFSARREGHVVALGSGKVQELFCYLLLHRTRPGLREKLASVLWPHTTTAQSKAYLRRALWQLQSIFKAQFDSEACSVLVVSPEWIQCNPELDLWMDVEVFEQAYHAVAGVPGHRLSTWQAERLQEAVVLYEGDLLESYYQEWCLYERERFRHQFVVMLDKLVTYHEVHRQYEVALAYAERNLACDRARERTHRQLMRLRYLADDRTGAIRQYESCVQALREDLDTRPSEATKQLYEQIRIDRLSKPHEALFIAAKGSLKSPHDILSQLKDALDLLAEAQDQVRKKVAVLEETLKRPDQVSR